MMPQPTAWYEIIKLVVIAVIALAFGLTIWRFIVERLDVAESAVGRAQDKFEGSLIAQLDRDREVALDFAGVLKNYNESNAETARQLSILAKSVRVAMAKKIGDEDED